MLTELGGLGTEKETLVVDLLTHIGCKEEYSDAWNKAVRLNGHSLVPRLGATTTFAVKLVCNMKQMRMKSIHCCLCAETGSSIFSTEMKITQTLGLLEYGVKPLRLRYTTKYTMELQIYSQSHSTLPCDTI
jgi:hypothetical protein